MSSLFIQKHNDIDVMQFWQNLKMPDVLEVSVPDFRLKKDAIAGNNSRTS